MKPFLVAVGLWPVGAGPAMFDVAERVTVGVRSVAGTVVGQNISHSETTLEKPGVDPFPEVSRRSFACVSEESRSTPVGSGHQERRAGKWCPRSGSLHLSRGRPELLSARELWLPPGSTELAPAATGGDLFEFLDVQVHQIARRGRFHPTDDATGGTVQPALEQLVTAEHVVHRGHVEPVQMRDTSGVPGGAPGGL